MKPDHRYAPSRFFSAAMSAGVSLVFAAALAVPAPARAQAYPSKPIRVVLPFAPGGVVDASMRGMAPKMSNTLGQPIVVDNRAGAGGTIGMAEVARAAPDGYTLLFTLESLVLAPRLFKQAGYDPERDFAPVSYLFTVPTTIIVSPSVGVSTLAELIALAKREPGKLSSGSGGAGTISHLLLEMIKQSAGVDIVHVPYKGMAPALTDFLAGQIQMLPVSTTAASPQVKAGKAKVLTVASPRRSTMMPEVPTTAELGFPGMEALLWMGLLAPAGTSPAIVSTLNAAALKSINDPVNARRYADRGIELVGSTPDEFRKFISSEYVRLGKIIAAAKIVAE